MVLHRLVYLNLTEMNSIVLLRTASLFCLNESHCSPGTGTFPSETKDGRGFVASQRLDRGCLMTNCRGMTD